MVSTNLIHPKVGQLEYLMFHTSHMYTQFTSCRITCIVAESCHEEHGLRKDDTQSKSGPFMFKKRDAAGTGSTLFFSCVNYKKEKNLYKSLNSSKPRRPS